MKRLFSTLLFLSIIIGTAFGQNEHGYNIFGLWGGSASGVGIGVDSRFKTGGTFGYSVSFATTYWDCGRFNSGGYRYRAVESEGISMPLEINAIFGKRASKFEIGVGLTLYALKRYETYIIPSYYKDVFRANVTGCINIGYRLQRKSGFFLKYGVTVLAGGYNFSPVDGVHSTVYLCLGYTIPYFR